MKDKKYIGEPFEPNKLYEKLGVYVGPLFPNTQPDFNKYKSGFSGLRDAIKEQYISSPLGVQMVLPVSFKVKGEDFWTIPFEPVISVSGGNKLIRRYPQRANKGGSIKEKWSQDDYQISIKGWLFDETGNNYPSEDVRKIRKYCEKGDVEVNCPLLTIFGIDRMVITKFSFPHTEGKAVQAFSISAVSDQLFNELLTEV